MLIISLISYFQFNNLHFIMIILHFQFKAIKHQHINVHYSQFILYIILIFIFKLTIHLLVYLFHLLNLNYN